MPALLRKLRKSHTTNGSGHVEVAPQEAQDVSTEPRDLFVLVPADGGLSFRVFAFSTPAAAAAYLDHNGMPIRAGSRHVAFRALHLPVPKNGPTEALEAVVLIRDFQRPGVVDLYSFVDMDSAYAFVQQEAGQHLDLRSVLMYWAEPVDLTMEDLDGTQDDEPAPVSTIHVPLPPRPHDPAPVTPAAEVPPLAAAPAAAPRKRQATRQATPPEDNRVRVHVSPNGAEFAPQPTTQTAAQQAAARAQPATGLMADIQAWGGWDGLVPLMIKASLANPRVYDDFDRDPYADGRGKLIVVLAAFAAVIGAMNSGLLSAFVHLPAFALGWGAMVYTVYAMGTQAFPGHRSENTIKQLSRTLALATSPAVLLVLGAVPTYGPLFVLGGYVWVLLTTTTAVSGVLALNRDMSLIVATVGCLALFTVSQVIPLVLV